ncbi:beta-D-xylosidase 5-like, partial [Trifolium medium]|nr:beta-D-xylosidase 5-like [Trifolium medium]
MSRKIHQLSTPAINMFPVPPALFFSRGFIIWSPILNVLLAPKEGSSTRHPNRGEDHRSVSQYVLQYVYGLEHVTAIGSVKAISFKGSSCCKHYTAYDFDKWNGM